MTTITLERTLELLPRFVASEFDVRTYIQTPIHGPRGTYATNGRMFIFLPNHQPIDEVLQDHAVIVRNFDKLLDAQLDAAWLQVPALADLPPTTPCRLCNGSGLMIKCRACKGDGTIFCQHCEHEQDCDACNGRGATAATAGHPDATPCSYCEGSGNDIRNDHGIDIGPARFATRYIRLLAELGAEIQPIEGCYEARWRFAHGSGVLMAIRKD